MKRVCIALIVAALTVMSVQAATNVLRLRALMDDGQGGIKEITVELPIAHTNLIYVDPSTGETVPHRDEGDNFLSALTDNVEVPGGIWTRLVFDDEIEDHGGKHNPTNGAWLPGTVNVCEATVLATLENCNRNKKAKIYLFENGSQRKRIAQARSVANGQELTLNGTIRFRPGADTNSYSIYLWHNNPSGRDVESGSTWGGNILK